MLFVCKLLTYSKLLFHLAKKLFTFLKINKLQPAK